MTEVSPPNQPVKGRLRDKLVACRQSTVPLSTGINPERKASAADAVAIGIARRVTHLIPQRLTMVKSATSAVATTSTDSSGRNHCWMAAAESSAVKPQVGTQPHQ